MRKNLEIHLHGAVIFFSKLHNLRTITPFIKLLVYNTRRLQMSQYITVTNLFLYHGNQASVAIFVDGTIDLDHVLFYD